MGVQSARVQQVIVGDDASFIHKLVKPGVAGNNEALVPVILLAGDVVKAIYESEQPETGPEVPDVEVTATFTPGESQCTAGIDDTESVKLRVGLGLTVRIEITRIADGAKETLYLYNEYDAIARGFPVQPSSLNLP